MIWTPSTSPSNRLRRSRACDWRSWMPAIPQPEASQYLLDRLPDEQLTGLDPYSRRRKGPQGPLRPLPDRFYPRSGRHDRRMVSPLRGLLSRALWTPDHGTGERTVAADLLWSFTPSRFAVHPQGHRGLLFGRLCRRIPGLQCGTARGCPPRQNSCRPTLWFSNRGDNYSDAGARSSASTCVRCSVGKLQLQTALWVAIVAPRLSARRRCTP